MPSNKNNKGFTLIEVLVVILIITILVSIVGVNVFNKPAEARAAAAKLQIKNIQTALQIYRTQNSRLPTQAQGLEALVQKPVIEPVPANYSAGGYMDSQHLPKDPWGQDFIYLIPGRQNEPFEIISYGGDNEPGGEGEDADISSSDPA